MDFTDADRLELSWNIDIRHEFESSAEGNGGTLNGVNLRSAEYLTRYCHMKSTLPLTPGQTVKRGDVIGVMGTTGSSTGNDNEVKRSNLLKKSISIQGKRRCTLYEIDKEVYIRIEDIMQILNLKELNIDIIIY